MAQKNTPEIFRSFIRTIRWGHARYMRGLKPFGDDTGDWIN